MKHKVIFTDIDGTLIDINTGDYGETKELLLALKADKIPVILCSAKTWAEQDKIREDTHLTEPFIVENGGAIIIPKDYFNTSLELLVSKKTTDYDVIELGKPAYEIKTKIDVIRKKYDIEFKGVSDFSPEELTKVVDISITSAQRMAKREYGETILQIEKNELVKFMAKAEEMGLKVIHGGRFFDVTIGNDKAKAVDILINLFREKYHDEVIFFGLGDSRNDASMLSRMDIPMLVQSTDGSWSNLEVKNIIKIQGIGPEGWKNAFNRIMNFNS